MIATPAHGAGSTWDTPEAVDRILRAYATPDVAAVRSAQIDLLGPIVGLAILDVGSGPGVFARDLALRGATVTALDSAPAMLAAVADVAAAAGVRVATAEGEAMRIPFDDASFDAAAIVQVLEYVPDAVGALREIARVLRPGGRVLACDTDWGSAAWGIADLDLADRVRTAWCGTKAHAAAGRAIPGWLVEAGFDVVGWSPVVLANADAVAGTFHAETWPSYRRVLERAEALPTAELDRFERLCAEATATGGFSFCVLRHAWVGRLAGGSR